MNDKDRDLIQQVLQAAGKAGEQGFGYLVHWQLVNGVTSLIGYLALALGAVWCLRKAFAWKPEDEFAIPVRGVLVGVLCILIAVFVSSAISGFRDVLAPEGAAIHSVLVK